MVVVVVVLGAGVGGAGVVVVVMTPHVRTLGIQFGYDALVRMKFVPAQTEEDQK